jgi:U3 small nucleolar RNA-associated protein 25
MAPNATGVLKRHRSHEKFDKKRDTKKHKHVEKTIVSNPSTDSPEESSIEAESEAMVYREPTQYQNLLVSLGSSNKVVADMNKRRYLYNVVCFNKFKSSVFGLFGSL